MIPENLSKPGGTEFKAVLEGDGVDSEHNSIEFTILTDNVEFSNSQVRLNLLSGESVVDFIGMDEGGLIFTTVDGELHVRTVTKSSSGVWATADVKLADSLAGEAAAVKRNDTSMRHGPKYLGEQGYFTNI